jgi:hypothetical protein
MVSVPTDKCVSTRFTLTPGGGTVVNEKRLRAIRACTGPEPFRPCVVYPKTLGVVFGEPSP